MNNKPLVSIITPSYERKKYLGDCINSVLSQGYENVEHIVVDGGSKDGTLDILQDATRDKRFRYISEPDTGMYDAINKGMSIARGDIVAYLNSDDRYFPWTISKAVDVLISGEDIVFGDLCVIETKQESLVWNVQIFPKFNFRYYLFFATIAQPTVFMKRSVIEKTGMFGNGFKLIADCDYWLRSAKDGFRLKKIDEIMALQINHQETLREKFPELLKKEFKQLMEMYGDGKTVPSTFNVRLSNSIVSRIGMTRFLFSFLKTVLPTGNWTRFREFLKCSGYGGNINVKEFARIIPPGVLQRRIASSIFTVEIGSAILNSYTKVTNCGIGKLQSNIG